MAGTGKIGNCQAPSEGAESRPLEINPNQLGREGRRAHKNRSLSNGERGARIEIGKTEAILIRIAATQMIETLATRITNRFIVLAPMEIMLRHQAKD